MKVAEQRPGHNRELLGNLGRDAALAGNALWRTEREKFLPDISGEPAKSWLPTSAVSHHFAAVLDGTAARYKLLTLPQENACAAQQLH